MNKNKLPQPRTLVRYSQAYKVEGLKDLMKQMITPKPLPKTQARKHTSDISTRVLFLNDSAYWIKDNALYTAKLIDGKVDDESTTTVDTMGMDKVQLDKTIFIVSKLTEGLEDDRSNTGN
jgi:hypothetical protein